MLRVESLTKTFPSGHQRLSVLQGLNASFDSGTFSTIRGASGSGKSTLLQLLGGLELPDSGTIRHCQTDLSTLSSNQLADWRNRSVGFVFQSFHLLPELNALENVELPAMIAGKPDDTQSMELLKTVGLEDRHHHRPSELSGGEQQRVAIARALRLKPEIILADEPTGNLDIDTAQHLVELLISLQQSEKCTLILVTHDPAIAQRGEHRYRLTGGVLTKTED